MKNIFLLTDYKDRFGSRHFDIPYRSGMDKNILQRHFAGYGYKTVFLNFPDIDFRKNDLKNEYALYTSSEDFGYHYKDYIEDIILGLELQGARLIPSFKYLRANNNKVFMEILRDSCGLGDIKNITSHSFSTLEDLKKKADTFTYPVVVKSARGATSKGVYLAKDKKDLLEIAKKIGRTRYLSRELWDMGRAIKHKGYTRESKYREKFIVQDFIPGLKNDWKIYVFGEKYYVFKRPILKKDDFRASGGGYDNYFYGENAESPEGIFDFAKKIFAQLDIPHASLDIAYDGSGFYLLEFQALYFGTAGIPYSLEYFVEENSKWVSKQNEPDIEKVFVESIVCFIKNRENKNK